MIFDEKVKSCFSKFVSVMANVLLNSNYFQRNWRLAVYKMNADDCRVHQNHVLAKKFSVVDINSEVCEMSLNRYGWPQIKDHKNS